MNVSGKIRVLCLLLADLFCIYGVWALVVLGLGELGFTHYRFGVQFYLSLWPMGVAYAALNWLFRLYHGSILHPSAPLSQVEEMRRLAGSAVMTHTGALAVIVLARQTSLDYSRMVFVVSGLLTTLLAQPVRDAVRALLYRFGAGQIPVVLVGSGAAARNVADALRGNAYAGLRIAGFFDRDGGEIEGLARLGDLRDILPVSRRLGVRIAVACEDERVFRVQLREWTNWFSHIEYFPTADIFPVFGSRTVSFGGVGGVEMVNQRRLRFLRVQKWLLDKSLALVAFVCLAPAFVLIAVLVKLTSRGPVFYRQDRLGQCGRPIRIWKFRTMYADADERLKAILETDPEAAAEWNANFKLRKDPRTTSLGRILRKTSLDEIPQLFNVFAGDMALVGPRPIVKGEVPLYGESYDIFSSVPPGITGLWQASGRSDTCYARRVALDVEYVLNWSPWLDVWILMRTVSAVLSLRGAC